MTKIKLLNSAMMPQPGVYRLREMTAKEFAQAVRSAHECEVLESYIGYPQTADFVSTISWIPPLAVNRSQTRLEDGDEMLIIRLKYRPDAPTKGAQVNESDFEFFSASYRKE